tara:strand:- start:1736 stop:1930 length:195 start_codon:yes stop_codon:yes gene_type:complete
MEENDIQYLLEKGYWLSCRPYRGKWEMVIYKKQKAGWLKRKRKLFNHPANAYDWALNQFMSIFG